MMLPFDFDFKNPDYGSVFKYRADKLKQLRANDKNFRYLRTYYKDHPAQFIMDWGTTFDPRNVERGLPSVCPFILFPRQEEWIEWSIARWKNQEPGLTDKSREMGLSWLMIAFSVTLCLFNDGVTITMGSRKEEYVDKKGDINSLLQKAREFILLLPEEFRPGWDLHKHSPYKIIKFPNTNSSIVGEAGDNIGRGGRSSIAFLDEAAWIARPDFVDAALSQNTNCVQYISTPNGMNNSFARKRFGGNINVFSFPWQDDPRKSIEWYRKKCKDIDDPVIIAQEIDLDYSASVEGVLIPSQWVQAAVDAHIYLGIKPTGIRIASLDIADEGKDLNAFCGRHGVLIESLEAWSGKGGDIFKTIEKSFLLSDTLGYSTVAFDADGLGAGARGDARIINEKREYKIEFIPFRGSGAVIDPTKDPFQKESDDHVKSRTNEDFFLNAKAQAWWHLRKLFKNTYRRIVDGVPCSDDDIISISSGLTEYRKLLTELSQPTYYQNTVGKIVVDKAPDGSRSPNLADAVMIAFAKLKKPAWGFGSDDYI